jgi:predicted GNAT family acetyltransferase
MPAHPLDRPVWAALTTGQAHLARGGPLALRFPAEYGLFAAARDHSPESQAALAGLAPPGGRIWLVEAAEAPLPPGLHAVSRATCQQMAMQALAPGRQDCPIAPLDEADAPAMLALATLTEPGPFFGRTHQLGRFVGVKQDGRLVAMAGERMKPAGFTEVSGVCTHPAYRGRGYAGALMRDVAGRILARGETPILHVYASNTPAIALYEMLGFRIRREVTMTVLERR